MRKKLKSIALLTLITLCLASCGIRGALYMPGEKPPSKDAAKSDK